MPTEGEGIITANLKMVKSSKKLNQGFLDTFLGVLRTKRSYALQSVSTSRSGEYFGINGIWLAENKEQYKMTLQKLSKFNRVE